VKTFFEFAEEQRLQIGWHVAKVGKGRDEMLAWSTVMVFRIDLYKLYHGLQGCQVPQEGSTP